MLIESDNDIERLKAAYDRLLCRQPSEAELEVLTNAWQQYRREFGTQPEAAKSLLEVGQSAYDEKLDPVELAAATALANVILNLEEATTRE